MYSVPVFIISILRDSLEIGGYGEFEKQSFYALLVRL